MDFGSGESFEDHHRSTEITLRAAMTDLSRPRLHINYLPELDLCLTCVIAEKVGVAGVQYIFEVNCCFVHSTGEFKYFSDHLYFEPDDFAHFVKILRNMQLGHTDHATLKNAGEEFVFRLDRAGRNLHLKFNIREYVAPVGLASFAVDIDVDYDIFVNKLARRVAEFLTELPSLGPEEPNRGFSGF